MVSGIKQIYQHFFTSYKKIRIIIYIYCVLVSVSVLIRACFFVSVKEKQVTYTTHTHTTRTKYQSQSKPPQAQGVANLAASRSDAGLGHHTRPLIPIHIQHVAGVAINILRRPFHPSIHMYRALLVKGRLGSRKN